MAVPLLRLIFLVFFRQVQLDVQFVQLLFAGRGRRIGHQIAASLVLREGNHLADVGSSAKIITRRSMPGAIPPCGGAPYSKASSKCPNFC